MGTAFASMKKVGLYARTLPHLKHRQIWGRILAPLRRRRMVSRLPAPPDSLTTVLESRTPFSNHDPWNRHPDLLNGHFRFLNQSADLGRPVQWDCPGEPLLWRFNLHYFNWLHLLEPAERLEVCRDWIAANPVGAPVAWHPYPTSLRIVNWCKAGLQERDVLKSLYTQAAWLSRNVETYVYGNHLLENARALVVAGCFFGSQGEAPAWLKKGLSIMDEELDEQILEDGCHFERSPMYQALMLEAVLDVLNVLGEDEPFRSRLAAVAGRMSAALSTLTHPDGGIALLNDSTLEIAPATSELLLYSARLLDNTPDRVTGLPAAGYHIVSESGLYMVADAGPPGPDYLLAHAHADFFSYELSLGGRRFVVDPGVYEYAAGEMRDYVRSTKSHSTVSVDGVDQIECWGSFRVGRRAYPQDVEVTSDNGIWALSGVYPGYGVMIGDDIVHMRSIHVDHAGGTIRIRDRVDGRGIHTVASRIHLHPDVHIESDGSTLRRDGVICRLSSVSSNFDRESGWYCPQFGRRIQSTVLVLEESGNLPIELEYTFSFEPETLT